MEPPIQGLNLRSMVLLLAMSFSLMLWDERRARGSRHLVLGSGKGQGLEWRGHSGKEPLWWPEYWLNGRRKDLVLKGWPSALAEGGLLPVESSGKALD